MNMMQRHRTGTGQKVIAANGLDWARVGLWVSKIEIIELDDRSKDSFEQRSFIDHSGQTVVLTADELDAGYAQIDAKRWHSRFLPVLAILVKSSNWYDTSDGNVSYIESGNVILNDDGAFSVITDKEYDLLYQVVGHSGKTKPKAPFSY